MSKANLSALKEKVKSLNAKLSVQKDTQGYWKPTPDSIGTGSAIIRFLPAQDGEEFPFIQLYSHAFQGPDGKWFIETCPTSLNRPCPVCVENRMLHASGNDAQKAVAAARKRKMSYVSNIVVVRDPKAPQNEGNIFLFRYGVKVMNKIKDLIVPEFHDLEPINPFDPESGANFRLRVVKNGNFPDYDKSSFEKSSPIGDQAAIDAVLKQLRSLEEIVHPRNFKSYDELKVKLNEIVGAAPATGNGVGPSK